MTLRPLIGISTSEMRVAARSHPLRESDPNRRELALGLSYPEAVDCAGGVPVVLPPATPGHVGAILDRLSGLCLSGGPDIEPSTYGRPPHPCLGPTEPPLDRFELTLARGAWERGMPILAICRGAQILNVSRGGTLYQHLPDVTDGSIEHRQEIPGEHASHAIDIEQGSLLAALLFAGHTDVNSFHHQAVERVGTGLRVVARSPDGVVEGIEGMGRGFAVGVQWHAEGMAGSTEQRALFRGFVDAAAEYERGIVPERLAAA